MIQDYFNENLFNLDKKKKNDIDIFDGIVDYEENVIHIFGGNSSGKSLLGLNIANNIKDKTVLYIDTCNAIMTNLLKNENMSLYRSNRSNKIINLLNSLDKGIADLIIIDNISNILIEDDRKVEFSNVIKKIIEIAYTKKSRIILINSMKFDGKPYGVSYQLERLFNESIKIRKKKLSKNQIVFEIINKDRRKEISLWDANGGE